MRRLIYVGILYLLFNALFCVPAFAADWEVYSPDIRESADEGNSLDGFDDFYEWQDYMDSLASPSVATRSNVIRMPPSAPALYSNYTPYDSSISTAVILYMSDALPKIGNVSYVLFRSGQYSYRLVYADDLQCDGNVFTSVDADYIAYDSRYYTWDSGSEGAFTLRADSYIVYSDLGGYPVLARDSLYLYAVLFLGVLFLLFTIYRSLFSPGRVVI